VVRLWVNRTRNKEKKKGGGGSEKGKGVGGNVSYFLVCGKTSLTERTTETKVTSHN